MDSRSGKHDRHRMSIKFARSPLLGLYLNDEHSHTLQGHIQHPSGHSVVVRPTTTYTSRSSATQSACSASHNALWRALDLVRLPPICAAPARLGFDPAAPTLEDATPHHLIIILDPSAVSALEGRAVLAGLGSLGCMVNLGRLL